MSISLPRSHRKTRKRRLQFLFPADKTGRYVVAATATDRKTALVSDETTLTGAEPAELPVQNETSFKIEHRAEAFTPGEKAVLSIQAPFGGVAWVSVETDAILDTLLVPLPGNAGRIELPIKKEYAPNATVSIYLVKPGGDKELPQERFAVSEIEVRRAGSRTKDRAASGKRFGEARRNRPRRSAGYIGRQADWRRRSCRFRS